MPTQRPPDAGSRGPVTLPCRLGMGAELLRTDPDRSWGAGPWGIRAKALADLMGSIANDHQPNWTDPHNPYCSCERDLWDGDCDSPDLVRWIPFLDTLGV